MPRKPNYKAEKIERERKKAAKRAEKERQRLEKAGSDQPADRPPTPER